MTDPRIDAALAVLLTPGVRPDALIITAATILASPLPEGDPE